MEQPGFLLRPSVVRERGVLPGRDDLGSLALLLGRVTSYWKTDKVKTADTEAERVLRQHGDGVRLPDEGLPDELEESLRELGLGGRLERYEHHVSHAANSYLASGFDRALIVKHGRRPSSPPPARLKPAALAIAMDTVLVPSPN